MISPCAMALSTVITTYTYQRSAIELVEDCKRMAHAKSSHRLGSRDSLSFQQYFDHERLLDHFVSAVYNSGGRGKFPHISLYTS